MGTVHYPCGCMITRSMYGEHEIIRAAPCGIHLMSLQIQLESLAEGIVAIQKKERSDGAVVPI